MELVHIDELGKRPPCEGKSIKQRFGKMKDFEELATSFTFYTPIVHHLIGDMNRTRISTDVVSHTLAMTMQEHPLVITDLPRPVFRFSDSLLLAVPELKSSTHTLYAVPTEQWNLVHSHLAMMNLMDPVTHRFCVLAPHVRDITNPIGRHEELRLPVWFFSCFGNRETYFFQKEVPASGTRESQAGPDVPLLCYHHPIREFVELAERTMRVMAENANAGREESMVNAAVAMEQGHDIPQLLAIRKQNELHRKIAMPLKESQLSEQSIRQCREIIRFYESTFGTGARGPC